MEQTDNRKAYVSRIEPGCYTSALDCRDYAGLLVEKGYELTGNPAEASVIIVSACVVSGEKEEESLDEIGRVLKRRKAGAEIYVGGCVYGGLMERLLGAADASALKPLASLRDAADIPEAGVGPAASGARFEGTGFHPTVGVWRAVHRILRLVVGLCDRVLPRSAGMPRRFLNTTYAHAPGAYFIRLGSSCVNSCSYCVTKIARGEPYSRDIGSILDEARRALQSGHDHLVLVSDDFTSYGFGTGADYVALLRELFKAGPDFSVTIYNFNPMNAVSRFDELLAAIPPGRVKCIHYVCQSGSDRILGLMNRSYTREEFVETARRLLDKDPGISLRTDIIVGFPGETEEDFRQSLMVVEELPFETMNISAYSARPGTPAARMPGMVPDATKRSRQRRLRAAFYRRQALRWLRCLRGADYV